MKWDLHIEEIVTKGSKRIHILRVLNRCGVLPSHLLRVYFVLIRPLLEYCCPVCHSSLSINLSDKIDFKANLVSNLVPTFEESKR